MPPRLVYRPCNYFPFPSQTRGQTVMSLKVTRVFAGEVFNTGVADRGIAAGSPGGGPGLVKGGWAASAGRLWEGVNQI